MDLSRNHISKVGVRVYKCPIGNQYYYGLKLYERVEEEAEIPFVDEKWSLDETENCIKIPEKHVLIGVHGYITETSHIQ